MRKLRKRLGVPVLVALAKRERNVPLKFAQHRARRLVHELERGRIVRLGEAVRV